MKIGLYINLSRDIDGMVSKLLIGHLKKRDVEYRIIERDESVFPDERYYSRKDVMAFADVIVVFGGDGTMLSIAVDASKNNVPLFGINVGHLGFLSEILPDKMIIAIDNILEGNFHEDTRDFLKVNFEDKHYYALNDVVLSREGRARMMKIDVYIDGIMADTMKADGVIVATPTGSTAYSLSCGGPILSPNVKAFVVNSICPHSLNTRPIVISADSEVMLSCNMQDENSGLLVLDGRVVEALKGANTIKVTKSEYSVKFLRLKETNFYNRLLSKMNTWAKSEDIR